MQWSVGRLEDARKVEGDDQYISNRAIRRQDTRARSQDGDD